MKLERLFIALIVALAAAVLWFHLGAPDMAARL